jgi:hypothetical protein
LESRILRRYDEDARDDDMVKCSAGADKAAWAGAAALDRPTVARSADRLRRRPAALAHAAGCRRGSAALAHTVERE